MADDRIDQSQHEALQRFADTRRQESEESEVIEPASKHLERSAIYIMVCALLAGLAIVAIGRLDVIVTARGVVEPRSQLVPVQSLNTGVVSKVLVSVGDTVTDGQLIMSLGAESTDADIATLSRQLELQRDQLSRNRAELAALDLLAPGFDSLDRGDLDLSHFGSALDLVNAVRVADLDFKRASYLAGADLERLTEQTRARLAGLTGAIAIQQENLAVANDELGTLSESSTLRKEQLAGAQDLMAKGIFTKTSELSARDLAVSAEAAINDQRAKIGALRLTIADAQLQVTQLQLDLAAETRKRQDALYQAERALAGAKAAVLAYRIRRASDTGALSADILQREDDLRIRRERAAKLEIRAPAAGTIAYLAFPSPGGRVSDGAEVARIVPAGVDNVITVELASSDVGRVRVGEHAIVKLDAYPFYRFGTVAATVASIFPRPGSRLFAVRLNLDQPTIVAAGNAEPIETGLEATVEIMTERRSILAILFDRGAETLSGGQAPRPVATVDAAVVQ